MNKLFSNMRTSAKGLIGKAKEFLKYVRTYWAVPPEGKALCFKEMAAYCVGGMGVIGASVLPVFLTAAAGIYIAAGLKIGVDEVVLIGIVTSLLTIVRSPLISYIVDNTNTKYGKFRPWLMILPIPSIICFFALGWIPALIADYTTKIVVFTILFNILSFFIAIYTLSFNTLLQVISPRPDERTMLLSAGAIVYSLGPSLVNMLIPLFANLMFTIKGSGDIKDIMGINTLEPFRWLIPIAAIFCFGLGYITAFYTKERTVISKTFKSRVKFLSGIKKTLQNKFFWIINTTNILGVFKMIITTFIVWICSYVINSPEAQTIATMLNGMACIPGMALAPMLIKKFGKKKLYLASNVATILMTGLAILFASQGVLILILTFFVTLINSVQIVVTPALNTEMYDYQQYKTGDRLEGFLSQFGVILLTGVSMITAFVAPFVYKKYGYNGSDNTVLSDISVLKPIVVEMLTFGVLSGILSCIPMMFWDFSEDKHKKVMEILHLRSKKEDGTLTEEEKERLDNAQAI